MSDPFATKSASILIVEASSGVRPIMSSALRDLGFEKIMSVDSLDEALNILAAESIDWLITSLFAEGKTNALQVLRLARRQAALKSLRVSLFVSKEEETVLPKAFALGLFTCHAKPFNQEEFKDGMSEILKVLAANQGNTALTAAHYLRPVLRANAAPGTLVGLEKKLNQAFPENVGQLLNLAEAHFIERDSPTASSLLWQAKQRDPKLAESISALSSRYLGVSESADSGWRSLALGTCVIVDPDTTTQAGLREVLTACGATEIQDFDNGEKCWQWLKDNKEPDLLVMEWRIPSLSSPLLLQRCRAHGFHSVSVIVHSSLVQPHDEPLLKEMGITEIARKPFRKDEITACIAATIQQARRPTEVKTLEAKIRSLLAANQLTEATNFMKLLLAKSQKLQDSALKHLEAEFAFAAGDYKTARDIATTSIRLGNKSVTLLNVLGKTLMRLRDFPAALKVFERANDIVPNSVARLCAIAETQQELGNTTAALEVLNEASGLDPDSQDVINTKVNVGLASGNSDLVAEGIDKFSPNDSILGYVNNMAVAHSKAGEVEAAIGLYLNALSALPKDKARIRATIKYNLALAYARKNDPASVVKTLERMQGPHAEAFARKVSSLQGRAQEALAQGKSMQLFITDELATGPLQVEKHAAEIIKKFGVPTSKQISTCLEGYFETPSSDLVNALLINEPTFQIRKAIVKG